MQSFLTTFSKYMSKEDIIVLAVSGGVDSMALLHQVLQIHPKKNIIVAHFDHSLRGSESDGDREFVSDFCEKQGISFEIKKEDIGGIHKQEKGSLEAIARRERYDFLEKIREKYRAKYILTAHHSDDQIETILLNLIKGGKSQGLSGMLVLSGNIFRPLLSQSKEDILKYVVEFDISFREDMTNMDTSFDRNKIRHQVIPILKEINPSFGRTIANLAEYMQELMGFFDGESEKWLLSASRETNLPDSFFAADFRDLDLFFQKEIIADLYKNAHTGSSQGLSTSLISELIRYIGEAHGSTEKNVGKLKLTKKSGIVFYHFQKDEKS